MTTAEQPEPEQQPDQPDIEAAMEALLNSNVPEISREPEVDSATTTLKSALADLANAIQQHYNLSSNKGNTVTWEQVEQALATARSLLDQPPTKEELAADRVEAAESLVASLNSELEEANRMNEALTFQNMQLMEQVSAAQAALTTPEA